MITREQSDKICDSIIEQVQNRFIKPIRELSNAMQNIIPKDKYDKTIIRKGTYTKYELGSINVDGNQGVSHIQYDKYGFTFRIRATYSNRNADVRMYLHGDISDDDITKIIFGVMPTIYMSDYFRYLFWKGKDDKATIEYLDRLRDGLFTALNGSSVQCFLADLKLAYEKLDMICDFVREKIELYSKWITEAYNLALEKEKEDDAMVLSQFGLTPEAVEPENFEIKIEVIKVNRGKKSTKKGKK